MRNACRSLCLCLALVMMAPLDSVSAKSPKPDRGSEFPVPEGFKSDYATIDGVRIHYVKGGRGPVVLLVHGFPQTWYEWHSLMPVLAADHTVVAIDLPGLGLSGAPASYRGRDVGDLIFDFVEKVGPQAPLDLVAHDVGIWSTYAMVVRHQSEIRKIVFADAPLPDDKLYTFPAFTPQGESLVWHFSFFNVKDDFAEHMVAGREKLLIEQNIRSHAAKQDWLTPHLVDLYGRAYARPGALHSAFGYYRALNADVVDNRALSPTKISKKVLAIGGGGHGGLGDFMGEQWRGYASNVDAVVLAGCGHWLPEECPNEFNSTVKAFLAP